MNLRRIDLKWLVLGSALVLLLLAWLTYLRGKVELETLQGGLLGLADWHPSFWLVLLALVTLFTACVLSQFLSMWLNQPSTLRGSAHWAKGREVKVYTAKPEEQAFVVGTLGMRRIAISEQRQYEHIAIAGTTGKGKTSLFFVPSLLRERGTRSLFAFDVKSELVAKTAGALSEQHQVWVFAPEQPGFSHHYNPLAYIHSFEDAADFARCWVDNTGRSQEPFWGNICEQLIAGAALHLLAAEPKAPLSRLADILGVLSLEELQALFTHSPSRNARLVAAPALARMAKNERLVGSVLTDLANRLFLLQSERIQQVTSMNEVDFVQMAEQPTALFFCVPDYGIRRLSPLSCSFMLQMFTTWIKLANNQPQRALPLPIICYLDEFGTAGSIPHMAEYIATLRSRRVALVLAFQGFAQLEERYGKEATETILSNASTHLVLRGIGQREAEFYSRRIGDTTVVTQSRSTRGRWETTRTRTESARRLIAPDEIRTMSEDHVLVLADVAPPLLVKAQPYYKEPRLIQRANVPWTFSRSTSSGVASQGNLRLLPPPGSSSPGVDLSPD